MTTHEPGWYPDPAGSNLERWFDGEQWGALKNPFEKPAPAPRRPTGLVATLVFALLCTLGVALYFVVAPHLTTSTPTTIQVTSTTLYVPPTPSTTVPEALRPVSSTTLPGGRVEYHCKNGASIILVAPITLNSCAGLTAP